MDAVGFVDDQRFGLCAEVAFAFQRFDRVQEATFGGFRSDLGFRSCRSRIRFIDVSVSVQVPESRFRSRDSIRRRRPFSSLNAW
jgi:hypothetical protein